MYLTFVWVSKKNSVLGLIIRTFYIAFDCLSFNITVSFTAHFVFICEDILYTLVFLSCSNVNKSVYLP